MRGIAKALLSDDPADRERAINREALRHAVSRAIFCERSGRVLDARSAVLVTVAHGKERAATVLDGAAWDEVADLLKTKAAGLGATLEVIDGREL